MKSLLEKLGYKGQKRIALISAEKSFSLAPIKDLMDVIIDTEIDQRFPYDFMVVFVRKVSEVEDIAPVALHNLVADGILWICYPKKTSKKFTSEIDRDHGWKSMNELDFYGVRLLAIDENWSAMRFRNKKYIKSTSGRFNK